MKRNRQPNGAKKPLAFVAHAERAFRLVARKSSRSSGVNFLGSTCASRVGDGALAIANFVFSFQRLSAIRVRRLSDFTNHYSLILGAPPAREWSEWDERHRR
jgi:hypothetical protein